jgi:hypothetical protein
MWAMSSWQTHLATRDASLSVGQMNSPFRILIHFLCVFFVRTLSPARLLVQLSCCVLPDSGSKHDPGQICWPAPGFTLVTRLRARQPGRSGQLIGIKANKEFKFAHGINHSIARQGQPTSQQPKGSLSSRAPQAQAAAAPSPVQRLRMDGFQEISTQLGEQPKPKWLH